MEKSAPPIDFRPLTARHLRVRIEIDMRTFTITEQERLEIVYARLHRLPPLGYKLDLPNWTFVFDETVAPTVKDIWNQALSGASTRAILEKIGDGFRTPIRGRTGGRPLHRSTLHDMLRDPFYAGYIRSGEKLCKGLHESMVTEENFLKVQYMLSERRRH